ncbi:MAG: DUF2157 domain-containing protein [Acidimicrobiia bacterium]|nr:DUF2157 domain-containing protein [Acidimicrobiia bacterium]
MASTTDDTIRTGARWLSGIGVALLAVAAVSLVSARWEQFGPGARLAILLGASAAVFGATELLRRAAPVTARALDVLVAVLVPIDVAALVIVSGSTWRSALVAAGLATVVSSETLRRRDPTILTDLGTVTGAVLAACGLAAISDVSAPLLVAGLGLVMVLVGPRDRWMGIIWAALAGLTPALRVLDEVVFTGMGTLREMGLFDAAVRWETVTVGAIATVALGLAAQIQRRLVAVPLAVAVAGATTIQVWVEIDPPSTVVLTAVAIVLGLFELALALPAARRLGADVVRVIGDVNAVCAGALTLVAAAAAWVRLTEAEAVGDHLQYTAAVLALVWVIADLRRGLERGQRGLDLLLVGGDWAPALPGVGVSLASAVYLGTDDGVALGVALAVVGLVAVATLRPLRLATAATAMTAAPWFTGDEPALTAVVAALAALVVAWVATQIPDRPLAALLGGVGLVAVMPGAVAAGQWHLATGGLFAIGVLWAAAWIVDRRVPVLAVVYRVTALAGLIPIAIDEFWMAAVVAATIAVVSELEFRLDRQPWHRVIGGVAATIAWWAALGTAEVDLVDAYLLPPVWLFALALAAIGVDRTAAVIVATPITLYVTVTGRAVDGRPVHTVVLGVAALAVAVGAAIDGRRVLLAASGSVAVAVAVFEGLAQSVGVETWVWLVAGGIAAVTAAGLLEMRDPDDVHATTADDAFVS